MELSPEARHADTTSRVAVLGNAVMSVTQFVTAAATGNVGFIGEAIHNASDAASFEAKRRGNLASNLFNKKNLERVGATLFATSGIVALALGAKNIIAGEHEDASSIPLGIAIGAFAVNATVAQFVKHRGRNIKSLKHTKEHAHVDSFNGGIYAVGLYAERWVPGIANAAIVIGGYYSCRTAYKHFGEAGHSH